MFMIGKVTYVMTSRVDWISTFTDLAGSSHVTKIVAPQQVYYKIEALLFMLQESNKVAHSFEDDNVWISKFSTIAYVCKDL